MTTIRNAFASALLVVAATASFAYGDAEQKDRGVAAEYTNGEIRKIDKETGKVTIKHDEIKNLGMPPMAMVFETKDAKVLDGFKTGDKVRFRADYVNGQYVLRDIEPAR